MSQEEITSVQVSPEVIYQTDKANIDSQVATAQNYPRNIKRCLEQAKAVVTLNMETAFSCTYAVPRAGKVITGMTVHFATIMAQTWGNIRCSSRVVAVEQTHVVSEAICWDLETNFALQVSVKRGIMTRTGRMSDDMIGVTGNAANSVAFRNAVLKVIYKPVVDEVYSAATEMITGEIKDGPALIARAKEMISDLSKRHGVKDQEILSSIGKTKIETLTKINLVVLMAIDQAIKDGDTTIQEAFKKPRTGGAKDHKVSSDQKQIERFVKYLKGISKYDDLEKMKIQYRDQPEFKDLIELREGELKIENSK